MPWVLVDIAIGVLAVLLLVLAALSLWRHMKGLFGTVRASSEKVGPATEALAAAQSDRPAP